METGFLRDVAEVVMGQSPTAEFVNKEGNGIPLLNGPTEFQLIHPLPVQFTTDAKKKAKASDLLFCVRGSTTGKMNWADQDYAIGRGIAAIRHNYGEEYQHFLRAIIEVALPNLLISATGSTFPNVGREQLLNIPLLIPSKAEQKMISSILRNIENKIQLNTQTNPNPRTPSRKPSTKRWFVVLRANARQSSGAGGGRQQGRSRNRGDDRQSAAKAPPNSPPSRKTTPPATNNSAALAAAFPAALTPTENFGEIPAGWEAATLGEICDMKNGYAFKSADWTESGIPVIKIGSVKPMLVEVEGNGFVDANFATSKPEFLVQPGDILVGLTGYVGEVGRMPHGRNAMLNQRVAKFVPKKIDSAHTYYNFVYCLARQDTFKRFAEGNAKGSAQANISTKELLKYPTVIADSTIHKAFESFTAALMEKILLHSSISWQLAKARDLLLPKLLNGEI